MQDISCAKLDLKWMKLKLVHADALLRCFDRDKYKHESSLQCEVQGKLGKMSISSLACKVKTSWKGVKFYIYLFGQYIKDEVIPLHQSVHQSK